MKRKIFISGVIMTGLLAVGSLGVLPVGAQDTITYPPIVQRLAERFNLNVEEVEDVFNEERAEHHANMLQKFEDRLDEAVMGGQITSEQKQAILDKHEEMRAKMEEFRSQDLTHEEMHEKMRAYHDELKTWAEEEGIEFPFMAFKLRGPRGGMGMFEEKLD